jgi:membrane protein implicated in regulation of membrane protease activity
MRKFLLFLISLLIGVGLFIWVLKIVGWQGIKNAFLVFTGWQGLVIFSLTLLVMLIGSRKWKEILKGEEVNPPFRDLF